MPPGGDTGRRTRRGLSEWTPARYSAAVWRRFYRKCEAPRPPSDLQDSAPDSARGRRLAPRHPIAPRQYLWIAGAVVVFASALHWLGPVLTPFLIGAILAYLGNPIVVRCARAGVPRTFGTLIAVVVMSLAHRGAAARHRAAGPGGD